MPPQKQCKAKGVVEVPQNPPGSDEVFPQILETSLTIRIPTEEIVARKYAIAVVNITNEEFVQLYQFQKQAWKGVTKQSSVAWKAFFTQFVLEWTAFPEFVSGDESGGYLYCAAGSIKLNTTVLLGCGMTCVACTTECANGTHKCVIQGHMGTRNSKMLLTTGF